jgi:hypothetical protein
VKGERGDDSEGEERDKRRGTIVTVKRESRENAGGIEMERRKTLERKREERE